MRGNLDLFFFFSVFYVIHRNADSRLHDVSLLNLIQGPILLLLTFIHTCILFI